MTTKNKPLLTRLLFTLSTLLFLVSGLYWFSLFLTKHAPLQTNHVLIEGWVGPYVTEQTLATVQSLENPNLYIVGKKYDNRLPVPVDEPYFWRIRDGLLLLTNSTMYLDQSVLPINPEDSVVSIAFEVTGSGVRGIYAHFTVIINGEKAGTFFTTDSRDIYQLKKPVRTPLTSLCLYYDNDLATRSEGRYLVIYSVRIGDKVIIPGPENTKVTFVRSEYTTGYSSEAAQMASYFIDLGFEKDQIRIIEYHPGTMNQTLLEAIAFRNWSVDKSIPDINVISRGYHSRRTWLTYNRTLAPDIGVGIINFPEIGEKKQSLAHRWYSFIQLIDESASYVSNWFYFTFVGSKEYRE